MKTPATLKQWDSIIEEISDERRDDAGYWVYFVPGYINTLTEVHMCHEDTLKECAYQLRHYVEKCECDDCLALLKKESLHSHKEV